MTPRKRRVLQRARGESGERKKIQLTSGRGGGADETVRQTGRGIEGGEGVR